MKLRALVALVALGLAGASIAYAAPKAAGENLHTGTRGTTTTTAEHDKRPG